MKEWNGLKINPKTWFFSRYIWTKETELEAIQVNSDVAFTFTSSYHGATESQGAINRMQDRIAQRRTVKRQTRFW